MAAHNTLINAVPPGTLWYGYTHRPAITNRLRLGDSAGAAQRVYVAQLTETPNGPILNANEPPPTNQSGTYRYETWDFCNPNQRRIKTVVVDAASSGGQRQPWTKVAFLHTLSLCAASAKFARDEQQLVGVTKFISDWCKHNPVTQEMNQSFRSALGSVVLESLIINDYTPPLPKLFLASLSNIQRTSWGVLFASTLTDTLRSVDYRRRYGSFTLPEVALLSPLRADAARRVFSRHRLLTPPATTK